MNYEQQYPQIDNIIDWNNPSPTGGNPNTAYDSPEPDQGKSAKTKNTSLLPTLGTGDPDKLMAGFENRRGPFNPDGRFALLQKENYDYISVGAHEPSISGFRSKRRSKSFKSDGTSSSLGFRLARSFII